LDGQDVFAVVKWGAALFRKVFYVRWSENNIFLAENQHGLSKATLGFRTSARAAPSCTRSPRDSSAFIRPEVRCPKTFDRFGKKFAVFVMRRPKGT